MPSFCDQCGAAISGAFCSSCGAPVKSAETTLEPVAGRPIRIDLAGYVPKQPLISRPVKIFTGIMAVLILIPVVLAAIQADDLVERSDPPATPTILPSVGEHSSDSELCRWLADTVLLVNDGVAIDVAMEVGFFSHGGVEDPSTVSEPVRGTVNLFRRWAATWEDALAGAGSEADYYNAGADALEAFQYNCVPG